MGERFELIAPCHFGMEAVLKREITDLGYEPLRVSDGKVSFTGDAETICRANICLRTAERVLLKVGEFTAVTYEELFQGTKAIDWPRYLPEDAAFWVTKATTVKSTLFSPSDIQSIMKKAMVESMKNRYHREHFEEKGTKYPVRVSLLKDVVTVCLDTTGDSLHKRGYRRLEAKAPIAENLAAAIIMLSPWKRDRILVDPFCGGGTFPIEAALMAANIAPGLYRHFTAENWTNLIERSDWKDVRDEAMEERDMSVETDIQGYDIDPAAIEIARINAGKAGVGKLIHLQTRPLSELSHRKKYGFIITNPPYGERIGDKETLSSLYHELGERYAALDDWSMYLITGYEDAERAIGRKADRNRKIYNGMLKTYLYEYRGAKPKGNRQVRKEMI